MTKYGKCGWPIRCKNDAEYQDYFPLYGGRIDLCKTHYEAALLDDINRLKEKIQKIKEDGLLEATIKELRKIQL